MDNLIIAIVYIYLLICILYTTDLVKIYTIKKIIKNNKFYCLYQPIVDLRTGLIYGYESLTRTNHPKYQDIKELIEDVYKFNLAKEFTLLALENSINGFDNLEENNKYLFVNIDPKLLKRNTEKIYSIFENCNEKLRKNIIVELTENVEVKDMEKLEKSLDIIKDLGVRFAVDDLGVGYSNINLLISISADFAKIDKVFISNIDKINKKRELIKKIVEYTRYIGVKTICEGIETKEELDVIIELGVDYGQGYYLGKPEKMESLKKEF